MTQTYSATHTGAADLYVVFTRNADGAARIVTAANTKEIACGIAASKNLEELLRQCTLLVEDTDLTTDENLVALCEAVDALNNVVHYDMDGYMAHRRLDDAKHLANLAAGIVELEATA